MKLFEYRAISKETREWVYGWYWNVDGKYHYIKNNNGVNFADTEIILETLGVKIGDYYVGDRLYDPEMDETYTLEYQEDTAQFMWVGDSNDWREANYLYDCVSVGTIHDRDLWKTKKGE